MNIFQFPTEITDHVWTPKKIILSTIYGAVVLGVSLIVNFFAGTYATNHAGKPINDLILDNLPAINVSYIFIDGIIIFVTAVFGLMVLRPRTAPFILKSLALFIIIRSFFIILTHMGPQEMAAGFKIPSSIDEFTFNGDLFFSAHTGLPFLMALIVWPKKWLRYIFLAASVIFGAAVLLGHIHYSIDVFGAFFITYTIFHISVKFFSKDFFLLRSSIARQK